MTTIRNSAKAIIIVDHRLLAVRHEEASERWHALPGGGQRPFETLVEALKRECLEEAGARVEVGGLVWVREYIGKHHEFAFKHGETHQVEFFFRCNIVGEYAAGVGTHPDGSQTGVAWLEVGGLAEGRLYPKVLRDLIPVLPAVGAGGDDPYLGDVN